MIKFINWLIRPIYYKVIPTTEVFEWIGGSYFLPVTFKGNIVIDQKGRSIPIKVENEEDARAFCILVNRALYKR